MDNQRNTLLSFAYYCQGKTMEELRNSLLYTTLELEQTRLAVQEELKKRDDQLIHLKDLLTKVIRERDSAQEKCQKILYEKVLLQQQQQKNQHQQQQQQVAAPLSGISSIEDEPRKGIDSNNGFSSSDCEESIVSSPVIDPLPPPPPQVAAVATMELVPEKPLPEKGKLLQAVMKAGPLLQTLLLAGPLPQWRHPPPPLESFEIPPVTITSPPPPPPLQQPLPPPPPPQLLHPVQSSNLVNITNCGKANRKRVLGSDASLDSPTETKYQRLILH